VADNILATKARKRIAARDSTLGERAVAAAVWAAMKAKTKIGMGLKTKKKKKKAKRIFSIAKRGDILPILPLLGILGSLAGGAAGVAKVVNDNKAAQHQLEELERHKGRVMEGQGSRHGRSRILSHAVQERTSLDKKKNVQEIAKRCYHTNVQLQQLANRMRIPYFRSIFMHTTLPTGVCQNESSIVNLDNVEGSGTHWVTYTKRRNCVIYFDSFGDLQPPKELARYLENNMTQIEYNRTPHQSNCDQLCLQFLRMVDNQFKDWYCIV